MHNASFRIVSHRGGVLAAEDVADIWSDLSALDLVLHPFDLSQDGPAVAAITTQLRRRHAIDSTYIRLALQLGTAMWTLDGKLARSAADIGLPVELITDRRGHGCGVRLGR